MHRSIALRLSALPLTLPGRFTIKVFPRIPLTPLEKNIGIKQINSLNKKQADNFLT